MRKKIIKNFGVRVDVMKKPKPFLRHNLFLKIIKTILKTFKKKPKLIYLDQLLPNQAIYYSNHNGAAGPLTLSMYFPKYLVPWGAHPMTENYQNRWNYLYHIFYQQKLKYSKFKSFVLATLFGLISKALYNGVQLIPTYRDIRLRKSILLSMEHLNIGNNILIFPEDSEDGYDEQIKEFHAGFVYLAKKYYQEHQKHIPIIPVYYDKKSVEIRIGSSYTLNDFKDLKDRKEIANQLKEILNNIGRLSP